MVNKNLNILIVDDDLEILNVYKMILEPGEFKSTTVSNPEKALELYKSTLYSDNDKFDVVIADMKMPEMSGFELLKQIKELDNNARIIIVSAFNDLETQNEANIYKPYAFLSKPFRLAELISILNKIEKEMKDGNEIKDEIGVKMNN